MKKCFYSLVSISAIVLFTCSCSNKIANSKSLDSNVKVESASEPTQREISTGDSNNFQTLDVYLRRLPGVTVSGDGINAKVLVRGVSTVNLSSEPLFVLDNATISGGYSTVFSMVNSNNIKRVNVISDASGLAAYGSQGSAGVILVTTKKNDNK
jgi:TonB-dependent SusC/RagA subfamily outer membrane receptor